MPFCCAETHTPYSRKKPKNHWHAINFVTFDVDQKHFFFSQYHQNRRVYKPSIPILPSSPSFPNRIYHKQSDFIFVFREKKPGRYIGNDRLSQFEKEKGGGGGGGNRRANNNNGCLFLICQCWICVASIWKKFFFRWCMISFWSTEKKFLSVSMWEEGGISLYQTWYHSYRTKHGLNVTHWPCECVDLPSRKDEKSVLKPK